jgi:hypothetical protein
LVAGELSGRRDGARQAGHVASLPTQVRPNAVLEAVDFCLGEAFFLQAGEEEVEVGVDVGVAGGALRVALDVDRMAVTKGDIHDEHLVAVFEILLYTRFRHDESQDRSEGRDGLRIHGISGS